MVAENERWEVIGITFQDVEYDESLLLPRFLFVKIIAVYNSLKPAERRVADCLIRDYSVVRGNNIAEIAEMAKCSEATVFRFSKKLGYSTFAEFKRNCLLEGDTKDKNNTVSIGNVLSVFDENDTPSTILKKTFNTSLQILQDTLATIDEDKFIEACEALIKARKIVSFGTGDAGFTAEILNSKLIRIGKQSYVSQDTDFIDVLCSQLQQGDVLVCFSHSGATKKVVHTAKAAKQYGAKVIAITNYPLSQLAKVADISLYTASFAESVGGENICKRLPELCIAESLVTAVLLSNEAYKSAHTRSIECVTYNKY